MSCENNPKHEHDNYCSMCSTCHDCLEEGRERDNRRIRKLEEFNIGLANENHVMREMLSNVVAAYCGHFADVSVGDAMRRELVKIEGFLNT